MQQPLHKLGVSAWLTFQPGEQGPPQDLVHWAKFRLMLYPPAALPTALASTEQQPHLEEVDLHSAIAEVQDDGTAGPEPGAEVGQTGQLVSFPRRDVSTRLQQVLAHVVPEVFQ